MKKVIVIALICLMGTMLFAAGAKETVVDDTPTIRLLTDATGIDDKSFNAAAWRGIVEFYGDTVDNAAGRGK